MRRDGIIFGLVFLLVGNAAYGCQIQDINYYIYMEKKVLISTFKMNKAIYDSNKRLSNTALPPSKNKTACFFDGYTKSRMVLKKDHGLTDKELELILQ